MTLSNIEAANNTESPKEREARIKAEARAYALSGTIVKPVLTEEQKKEKVKRRREQRRKSAAKCRKRQKQQEKIREWKRKYQQTYRAKKREMKLHLRNKDRSKQNETNSKMINSKPAMNSDFEILKEYILKCPTVGNDTPAMKAALWGLKTEKKRRTPANISSSLPRSGTSTWCWLKPSLESNNTNSDNINSDNAESSDASPISDDFIQPDEIPSSLSLDLVVDPVRRNRICEEKSSHEEETEGRKRPLNASKSTRPSKQKRHESSRKAPTADDSESGCNEEESVVDDEESTMGDEEEFVVDNEDGKRGIVNYNPEHWEEQFQVLVEYQEKYGTTNVPSRSGTLGRWVARQRTNYKMNKLPEYRKKKLNSINFQWNGDKGVYNHELWEEQFQLLVEYRKKHGTTNVPQRSGALGIWVSNQRQRYMKNEISEYRKKRLNSINFEWSIGKNKWRSMYNKLIDYKKEYATTRVPQSWKEDPQLGRWVYVQRRAYSKSKLSRERIDLLESIGFGFQ